MAEIVGGLNIKDVAAGGTMFEVKYEVKDDTGQPEYLDGIESFTKLECLDLGNEHDEGEPFDNFAEKMDNLLQNGKIKKRILKEGYGSKPDQSSNVTIHYNAYVQYEAHPFDSTYARKKTFSFVIGDGQVIEGLEIAVLSMKLNEKSQFLIVPELAYRNGGLNRIPPNSTVLFEIELCGLMESVVSSPVDTIKNDFDYVYKFCLVQCVKGKHMFRVKNYHDAIKEYTVAVHQLEKVFFENYEEQEKSDELLVRLCTNLLICYTYVQNPKKGCIFAQRIYDMKKNKTFNISAKVYFNHAKCLRMLGNFDKAERKLYQAKRIEAHNPEILQEYLALKKTAEESKKRNLVLGKTLVNCK